MTGATIRTQPMTRYWPVAPIKKQRPFSGENAPPCPTPEKHNRVYLHDGERMGEHRHGIDGCGADPVPEGYEAASCPGCHFYKAMQPKRDPRRLVRKVWSI